VQCAHGRPLQRPPIADQDRYIFEVAVSPVTVLPVTFPVFGDGSDLIVYLNSVVMSPTLGERAAELRDSTALADDRDMRPASVRLNQATKRFYRYFKINNASW
jgi:hypothetical protein